MALSLPKSHRIVMAWRIVRQERRARLPALVGWTFGRGLCNCWLDISRRVPDMALVIEGEERIAASVQKVWQALNDPDTLKACIPGCETLEKKSDTELAAIVVLKIGPIKARFAGEVTLKNLNPPHSYTIEGEGKGGIAG